MRKIIQIQKKTIQPDDENGSPQSNHRLLALNNHAYDNIRLIRVVRLMMSPGRCSSVECFALFCKRLTYIVCFRNFPKFQKVKIFLLNVLIPFPPASFFCVGFFPPLVFLGHDTLQHYRMLRPGLARTLKKHV